MRKITKLENIFSYIARVFRFFFSFVLRIQSYIVHTAQHTAAHLKCIISPPFLLLCPLPFVSRPHSFIKFSPMPVTPRSRRTTTVVDFITNRRRHPTCAWAAGRVSASSTAAAAKATNPTSRSPPLRRGRVCCRRS